MVTKEFKAVYKKWIGKNGFLHCPKCDSISITHIAIPYEGQMLICYCGYKDKIGEELEEKKIKKGLRLGV